MNERILPGLAVVGLIAVILLVMWLAWRARRRRDAAICLPHAVPPSGLDAIVTTEVLHVATTRADEPLERVATGPLAFRARGDLTVAREGVVIAVRGGDPVFIEKTALEGAGPATWTIDRVVERDGLIMIRWAADGARLDSYLRVTRQADHIRVLEAIATLIPAPHTAPSESENNQ